MKLKTSPHVLLSPATRTITFLQTNKLPLHRYYQNIAASPYLLDVASQRSICQHEQGKCLLPAHSPYSFHFKCFSTTLRPSRDLRASSSSAAHISEPSPLSTDQYHRLSDAYIDALVVKLEDLQEEREDVDVQYSAGVLTLVFPPAGTYVLNKQPPNKQIWLSSPISGPKRYDWVETTTGGKEGNWIYLRDGSALDGLLAEEIGINLGLD